MWEGLGMILALGGIMAAASFLAGSLPLSFSLSQSQMRFISSIGTGLLVGTALVVIIPEGIETMYNAKEHTETKAVHGQGAQRGGMGALAAHRHGGQIRSEGLSIAGATDSLFRRAVHEVVKRAADKASSHAHEDEHSESSHAWIGIALVLGFILMYLIDASSSSPPPSHHHHIPLTSLDDDNEAGPHASKPYSTPSGKATTLGLVIHSFADGIALGASSASTEAQKSLGLIVFAAILVHKAPAAFGLTSVLLKQGLGKRAARGHLLVFSLAAPLGAVVTWTLVNILGSSAYAVEGNSAWWTGLVLVFSGGTFLYVAMHAMQESGHAAQADISTHPPAKSRSEILLMVTGMLLPLLTQVGHAHAHGH